MKKHVLFYLLFAFLAINARAQQNTVITVGSGTEASSVYGPAYISNAAGAHTSQFAAMYKASEISATPFTARVITKIAWNKLDTARYNKNNGVLKIYIKNTSAATLTTGFQNSVTFSTELNGTTLVYSSSTQNITTGAGWKTFTLTTPFVWNGTDNLEIAMDWSQPGAYSGTAQALWETSSFTPAVSNLSAFLPDPFTFGSISGQTNRPNVQLTFTEFSNDAGISAITAPTAVTTLNSNPVQATIKNFGTAALTTAKIGWKVNGAAQTDYTYTGNLATGQTDGPLTLGNFSFPIGTSIIKAYTKSPNGGTDGLAVNDTTIMKVVACNTLSGNYTINKTAPVSATNVQSFTDAATILNSCGVNGPVTFTVTSPIGTIYTETLELANVPGASSTNTITFEGNGNILTMDISSSKKVAVKIDGVKYFKLNNLNVRVTASTGLTTGYGIQVMNKSDNATITNCKIEMPTSFGQDLDGIVFGTTHNAAGETSSNALIQNNILTGGGYAIRLNGLSQTAPAAPIGAANIRIIGNQIQDFAQYGIFLNNLDGALVEGNDISRPTRALNLSAFTGIYLSGGPTGCRNSIVNKNRIHNPYGGALTANSSGATGIGIDCATPVGSENIVKNNLIYDLNCTGNIIGIVAAPSLGTLSDGVFFYNNTIAIENSNRTAAAAGTIKGFALGGVGSDIRFINNIISINALGSGFKTAIFYQNFSNGTATIAFTFQSHHNVFYIAPGLSNAYVGYLATPAPITTASTLAAWQALSPIVPYDMNSIEANPAFANFSTGNLTPTNSAINDLGQVLPAVTDDFLSATARNGITSDPGAYEFTPATTDAGISGITAPISGCDISAPQTVTVNVNNYGSAAITSVPVSYTINGGTPVTETIAGPIAPGTTLSYSFTTKANISTTGTYNFAASTGLTGDAVANNNGSASVVVSAVTPPAPTVTAGAMPFCSGSFVTLTATSTITGATFQWFKDGVAISGATFNTYSANAAANYTAVATALGCPSPASAPIAVTVYAPVGVPTVTAGGSTVLCEGSSVVLTAVSTSTGATYTWFKGGVVIAGATSDTYTATTPGNYTAKATVGTCTSAASSPQISVTSSTAIPTVAGTGSATFCDGGSIVLTATSATTGATFQWYKNTVAITGATNATYTATTSGTYTAKAILSGCSSFASLDKIVTVNTTAVPTITAGGSTALCTGGSVVLTAASTTTGATYTWFKDGVAITGATAATYTANAAGSYTAVATAGGCPSVASTASTVTLNAPAAVPTITAGGSTTLCTGGSVTLTAASATTGATYTWFKDGVAITGATAATYSATAAGNYTAVATASGCPSAASTATAVIVNTTAAVPTITAGGSTTLCTGGSVVLTAASTTTGATYTWFKDGVAITGATSATYTATTAGNYTAVATASACPSAASVAKAVIVNTPAAVPTITAGGSTTLCTGGSVTLTAASTTTGATYTWFKDGVAITGATAATYSATAAGSYTAVATASACPSAASTATAVIVNTTAAVPTITAGGATTFCTGGSVTLTAASTTTGATYTWFKDGVAITGATTATYAATAAGNYTAVATASGCPSAASVATPVTVNAIAAVPTITAGGATTFCTGGSVVLTAASTTTGATYTWFKDGVAITGATLATYTATTAGNYTAVATASACPSAASVAKAVIVNTVAAVPTITASGATTFCAGGTVTLTAASATTGATYTWFKDGVAITGATAATYAATAAGNYTAVATANTCPSAASVATPVTVNALPTPTITGLNATYCSNEPAITLTGSIAGSKFTIDGVAATTFDPAALFALSSGPHVVAVSYTNASNCTGTATQTVTIKATPAKPTIAQAGNVLTSSAATGNQWYMNGTIIPGATNATYTSTANGSYTVIVTDNGCASATSNPVAITATGLADNMINSQVVVYPNPSNGTFNISLPTGKTYQLVVTDLTGKVIIRQQADSNAKLNLEGTAKGIYLLKVSSESGSAIRKLIVE